MFFPKTAHAYAQTYLSRQADREASLQAAVKAMQGSQYSRGDMDDPYIGFCMEDENPINEEFETLSLAVFEPLFEHSRKIK